MADYYTNFSFLVSLNSNEEQQQALDQFHQLRAVSTMGERLLQGRMVADSRAFMARAECGPVSECPPCHCLLKAPKMIDPIASGCCVRKKCPLYSLVFQHCESRGQGYLWIV